MYKRQSEQWTITEPTEITIDLEDDTSILDVQCYDQLGNIDVSIEGGTPGYTYQWYEVINPDADPDDQINTEITSETNPSINGLGDGTYFVVATDANECPMTSEQWTVIIPPIIVIETLTAEDAFLLECAADDNGTIEIEAGGGVGNYSYEWSDGSTIIGNTPNISGLSIGNYSVTVTDANGCVATFSTDLTQPEDLIIDIQKTDLNCYNSNDGTITVTPTGGVAPYTYSWSDFGNGKLRTDLVSGKYTVTVTDSNNCEKSVEIELKSAPQFNITSDVSPITCFGANDGSIKLTIDGGKAPISLEWADDPQAGTTRSNLKSGVYSVLLKDSSGCEINEIYTITEPAKLQLSAIKSDALDCDDPNSGSIDLQVIGGNPPFTYVWSNGDTTEDLSDVSANNYSVIVTDSKGCTVEKTFSIVRPFELQIRKKLNQKTLIDLWLIS